MASRRRRRAARAVVPEPEKGSRTKSPSFEEGEGFLGGMLAEALFPGFGRLDFPDGFHLLAAIGFLHELVIEGVAGFFVASSPDDGFGGVGEIAAGEVGRRIRLNPGDVVE